jgi:hypothetical protein
MVIKTERLKSPLLCCGSQRYVRKLAKNRTLRWPSCWFVVARLIADVPGHMLLK